LNELLSKIKKLLSPGAIVTDINRINFGELKAKGINALILDIDDTIIPRENHEVTPALFEWVMNRKDEGFRLCLASNSRHPLRVKQIGEALGLPYLCLGFKPLPFAFWRSLEILKTKPAETAMIGDQLFMDILGANLVGIFSIFIDHRKNETTWWRIKMREAEQWVLGKLAEKTGT
jgi:hypothetical protein